MHRLALLSLLLVACQQPEPEPTPLLDVPESETWFLPGMNQGAYVVRVEGSIPHIYAKDREDLVRVLGFVQARDRFFEIDMTRRLGLGTVSELLGDAALESDFESRGSGMTWIADRLHAQASPETLSAYRWFAEGVNAYIAAVEAGDLPPPSEYELAAGLLGADDPAELLQPFDTRSMAGVSATILYNLGYETGDVGRARTAAQLDTLYFETPLGDTRRQGVIDDIWGNIVPPNQVASADGWGLTGTARSAPAPVSSPALPASLFERAEQRNDHLQQRMHKDWGIGFGSNAWAVAGSASAEERALLASDGHLPLSIPSLFWHVGLNTAHLGDGDLHQVGALIPGMPIMAVGTNGQVAWSQTQLGGDITDWYREEIRLDADGAPVESLFQGEWRPLEAHDETYEIAEVSILGSEGRTETWARWTTFDGRWIADIEGRDADPDEQLAEGETLVNLRGDWVVPGDVDDDGVITALSFDYVGFDAVDLIAPPDDFGRAADVWQFREATRGLLAYSQNMVVADASGSILYTGYQAVPCRDHLDRLGDGAWAEGADPTLLLDGTQYGGFEIPVHADGTVDESGQGSQCVVPFDEYPYAVDPAAGYVQNANNDPAGLSFDNSLTNDDWYIGGPWLEGYRAARISEVLEADIAAGAADLDAMADLQADHHSVLGEQFAPVLLQAIETARTVDDSEPPAAAELRLNALYLTEADALDEVHGRLTDWAAAGFPARSGVDTFYDPLQQGDLDHAVATTLFNAWIGRYQRTIFDDEGLPDVWEPSGTTGRLRALTTIIEGRGAGNPSGLSSWHEINQESAFFDILGTEPLETSHEVALIAMIDALDYLRSAPTEPGRGGFGSDDMGDWIWGYRHFVEFDPLIADLLGGSGFDALLGSFAITPEQFPLEDPAADELPGFPRHGDHVNVDAANSGLSGRGFDYSYGPVFRMVIALGPDGVEGRNIIPGGQSGLTDSEHFDDQVPLWLANETWPMRYTVDEVVEGATHRETFPPAPPW